MLLSRSPARTTSPSKIVLTLILTAVVPALSAACTGGDAGPSVAQQCDSLVTASDAGMKKIEAIKDDDPAASAKAFEAFAADVGKIGVKDPELKKLADEYVKMLTDAAATQTSLANLMKKMDAPATSAKAMKGVEKEIADLEKAVDKYVKTEDQLVDKINAYCAGK